MEPLITNSLSVASVLLLTTLTLTGYVLLSWLFNKTRKKLPPGPREWGTTWRILRSTMDGSLHELASEWAKEYGPIVYVNFLGKPIVYLNTADMSRRIMASEESKFLIADRVPSAISKIGMYDEKGLIFSRYDATVRKKRKLFFQAIALYGDGVEKFENVVLQEMARLFRELEQHENEDYELWKPVARSLKIIIYILCIGDCPPDPDTPDILEEYDIAFNKAWEPEIDYLLSLFPFLAKVPGKIKRAVDRLKKAQKEAEELVYYSPERSHVPGRQKGMVDVLLDLRKKPGNEWMEEDPIHLVSFMMTIFITGHLTTRSTILNAFLILMNYPKVAKKIQEEIDRILANRHPRVEDRSSMPYTEAFILEVTRLVTVGPLGAIRTARSDIDIDGMTIPEDTLVINNSWFAQHDETIWEDPWTLKPERFLNSSGQILPADDPVRKGFIPFGIGLRSCPGEVFARTRTFMFVTCILQKYDILPPANEKPVPADFKTNHDSVKGFIRQAQPFKCRLSPRHKTRLR